MRRMKMNTIHLKDTAEVEVEIDRSKTLGFFALKREKELKFSRSQRGYEKSGYRSSNQDQVANDADFFDLK